MTMNTLKRYARRTTPLKPDPKAAAAFTAPLIIPQGAKVYDVVTTALPWGELRLDVTLAGSGEVITRAGQPNDIFAMSQHAASLMEAA